jgi:radical SAM superfamily enzyme YgiQ (UPF0313 family)
MFSPDRAVHEIELAKNVFIQKTVSIQSDTLGIDTEWLDEFMQKYDKRIGLPFLFSIRPELATEKVIAILGRYKCSASIGLESGSERIRKDYLNRNMSNVFLLEVADRMHRYNIPLNTSNMIGLPSETEEEIWDTINLNIEMKVASASVAIWMPFPGADLTEIAIKEGYLDSAYREKMPTHYTSGISLRNVDNNMIDNFYRFFKTAIKFPNTHKLIRKLVRMKPLFIFKLWSLCFNVWIFKTVSRRSWISILLTGLRKLMREKEKNWVKIWM